MECLRQYKSINIIKTMKKVLFFAAMLGLAVACAETKKVEENNAEETATVEAVEVVEEAVEAPAEVVVERNL